MFELDIIKDGIIRMFKNPLKFFTEVSREQINLVIPVVVLLIAGIFMSLVVFHQLPEQEKQWKELEVENAINVKHFIRAEKVKAVMYPVWCVFFWVLFTIAFAVITSALNGWGEFHGFFNCTSFLIYPLALLQLIRFILGIVPALLPVYTVLMIIACGWLAYMLFLIAKGAGGMDTMHSVVAAGIPAFFFLLLWISYGPLVNMIIVGHRL